MADAKPARPPTARELIEEAARDPGLSLETAAAAYMRIGLMMYLESSENVSLRELGDVLTGAGAILKSKPPEAGGIDELQAFLYGGKNE